MEEENRTSAPNSRKSEKEEARRGGALAFLVLLATPAWPRFPGKGCRTFPVTWGLSPSGYCCWWFCSPPRHGGAVKFQQRKHRPVTCATAPASPTPSDEQLDLSQVIRVPNGNRSLSTRSNDRWPLPARSTVSWNCRVTKLRESPIPMSSATRSRRVSDRALCC